MAPLAVKVCEVLVQSEHALNAHIVLHKRKGR